MVWGDPHYLSGPRWFPLVWVGGLCLSTYAVHFYLISLLLLVVNLGVFHHKKKILGLWPHCPGIRSRQVKRHPRLTVCMCGNVSECPGRTCVGGCISRWTSLPAHLPWLPPLKTECLAHFPVPHSVEETAPRALVSCWGAWGPPLSWSWLGVTDWAEVSALRFVEPWGYDLGPWHPCWDIWCFLMPPSQARHRLSWERACETRRPWASSDSRLITFGVAVHLCVNASKITIPPVLCCCKQDGGARGRRKAQTA